MALGRNRFAAQLVEDGREHQRMGEPVRFRHFPGQRHRLVETRERAIRLAAEPQAPAGKAADGDAGMERIDERRVTQAIRLLQRDRLVGVVNRALCCFAGAGGSYGSTGAAPLPSGGIGSSIVEVCGSSSPSGDVTSSSARAIDAMNRNANPATSDFMALETSFLGLRDHQVHVQRLVRIAISKAELLVGL
jgi:hypothetical protein